MIIHKKAFSKHFAQTKEISENKKESGFLRSDEVAIGYLSLRKKYQITFNTTIGNLYELQSFFLQTKSRLVAVFFNETVIRRGINSNNFGFLREF